MDRAQRRGRMMSTKEILNEVDKLLDMAEITKSANEQVASQWRAMKLLQKLAERKENDG